MRRFSLIISILLLASFSAQFVIGDESAADVACAPGVKDLGQPVSGARDIWDLATWRNGLKYKVFGGTSRNFHLLSHDPTTGVSRDLGAPGFEWYSIQAGRTGLVYGGGYRGGLILTTDSISNAVIRNAHFGIYNPRKAWKPGANPRDMGPAVLPPDGSPPRHPAVIFDLAESTRGLICGGTGYAYDVGRYDYSYLFAYNPRMRWEPGVNPVAKRFPLRSQQGISRLTAGRNGMIYGLSISASQFHLFEYDPVNNNIDLIMGLPAAPEGNLGAITTGLNGRIYIGIGRDIYVHYPDSLLEDGASPDGQIPARGNLWRMITGPDGRIYCGTDQGELIVYDPRKPWKPGYEPGSNPRNLGYAIYGERRLRSLTAGTDGMVYGGTGLAAHLFQYTPIIDLGQPVAQANNIWDLTTGTDRNVYGGTGRVKHVFSYDPTEDESTDLGRSRFEWYSTQAGRNGFIYGGGYRGALMPIDVSVEPIEAKPVAAKAVTAEAITAEAITAEAVPIPILPRNAHFGIYNPRKPWEPGVNPRDMGPAVLIGGRRPPHPAVIFDMVETTNYAAEGINNATLICGGTGYEHDVERYDYAYVFCYNANLPWKPGSNPCSRQIPLRGQRGVSRVTAGRNGMIYGLSVSASRINFFGYDPGANQVDLIMEFPSSEGNLGALTTGLDGRIYIGIDRNIYAYTPGALSGDGANSDGRISGVGRIWRMTTGRRGKIYIGTDRGEFAVYDPGRPWNPGRKLGSNPRGLGKAVRGEWKINTLTTGVGGKIYGGTGQHAHLFEYIPVPRRILIPELIAEPAPLEVFDKTLASKQPIQAAKRSPVQLLNSYPSPCNPETWIPFSLTRSVDDVMIRIYNINGRLVRTLDLGNKTPGLYDTRDRAAYWDGKNESGESVGSGIYFYQIRAGEYMATKKMVVAR